MRRWYFLGFRARLSTSESNFLEAEIRIENLNLQIQRLCNNCVWSTPTHQLLEESNLTIATLPEFPQKMRFQRSWGSEQTVQCEQFSAVPE
jgi:hypothetical protein